MALRGRRRPEKHREEYSTGSLKSRRLNTKGAVGSQPESDALVAVFAVAFLAVLPFVVSPAGYEKFRLPKDVFAAIAIAALAGVFLIRRVSHLRWSLLSWDTVLVAGPVYVALHTLFFGSAHGWTGVAWISACLLLFFCVRDGLSEWFHRQLWLVIGAAMAVNAVLAVLEYYGRFPLMLDSMGATIQGRMNPAGLIGDVNSGGFLFGLCAFILLFGLFAERRPAKRALCLALIVTNLAGLAASRTLTAAVALGLSLVLWLVFHLWWTWLGTGRKHRANLRLTLVMLVAGIGLAALLFAQSAMYVRVKETWSQIRSKDWSVATSGRQPAFLVTFEMIKERPITGRGLNSFPRDFFYFHAEKTADKITLIDQPGAYQQAHNEYLQIWEELGLPAFLMFVVLLFGFVGAGIRAMVRSSDAASRYWSGILCLGLVFVAISCLGFFPLHLSVTAPYIVVLLASLSTVIRDRNGEKEPILRLRPIDRLPWQAKLAAACLVVTLVAIPQIQTWRSNSRIGLAELMLDRARDPRSTALEKRAYMEGALRRLDSAIELAPGLSESYNLQGAAFMLLGRYQLAAEKYEVVVREAPSPESLTNLATAYMASGRPAEARKLLKTALRYNPWYRKASQALRYLDGSGD